MRKKNKLIAQCEKSLALEKLKNRRADTRRKIEFGGLVIKAGMNEFNKLIILGALDYAYALMKVDSKVMDQFQYRGEQLVLGFNNTTQISK